jgi:hypothetical protein
LAWALLLQAPLSPGLPSRRLLSQVPPLQALLLQAPLLQVPPYRVTA